MVQIPMGEKNSTFSILSCNLMIAFYLQINLPASEASREVANDLFRPDLDSVLG